MSGRRSWGAAAGRAGGPAGLLLLLGLLQPPLQAQGLPPGNDFGRWTQPLSRCRLIRTAAGAVPGAPAECWYLRLDQLMEGMVSVRFINPAAGRRFLDHQLIFAGVLEEGSASLRCRQSRCEPRWPLRLRVSAVGQSGLEALEPDAAITGAQLATGRCLLEAGRFQCDAEGADGRRWSAEAEP